MSTLERLDLLSPILDSLDEAWPNNDTIICSEDATTVVIAFRAWFVITSDILYNRGCSTQSVLTKVGRLCTQVQLYKPSLVLIASKKLYDTFLDIISGKTGSYTSLYVHFKDELANRGMENLLISALVAPVNKILSSISTVAENKNGCWITDYGTELKDLAQYFGFLMKAELNRPDLEADALEDYKIFEATFPKLDRLSPYLKPLRTIIQTWTKDFVYDGTLARHGNGSVANTTSSILQKYLNIETDVMLEYLYIDPKDQLGIFRYFPLGAKRTLKRISKLCFVPKNVSKLRSISMEPASLQFVQQGVMRKLYKYIAQHPYLGSRIKLKDQEQNKSFAYHGSITDEYSTIDLSAASDSVSFELTKFLFCGNTKLWKWLLCTRSSQTILPNGEIVTLKKFAPMGSALCFPIETLIFAAVAELAVQIGRETGATQDIDTGIYKQFYTVYGDDIIIPKGAYDITREILHSLNFKVNEDKSYHASPFKESCGGNYLAGVDVTPIKWKCRFPNGKLTPESYDALCAEVNQAYDKRFKIFRAYCIHLIDEYGKIPYFTSDKGKSPFIYSPTPTNFKAKKRYSKRFQATEIMYTSIGPSERKPITHIQSSQIDEIVYTEWLRLTADGLPVSGLYQNKEGGFEYKYCKPHIAKAYVDCDTVFKKGKMISYE